VPGVRILLDQDIPYDLVAALAERGYYAVHVSDVRLDELSDPAVYTEAGRVPTVLVACNVRDHADRAFHEAAALRHRLAVALVVTPRAGRRAAIRDVVHRWAHRLPGLAADAPAVASLSRTRVRVRRFLE
jgi:hypothetical protein